MADRKSNKKSERPKLLTFFMTPYQVGAFGIL